MLNVKLLNSAKLTIDDEISNIYSFEIILPRYLLAELNTHRVFTRNSASSRALNMNKTVMEVLNNDFKPYAYQKEHKGMQGQDYITDSVQLNEIKGLLHSLKMSVLDHILKLKSKNVSHQILNRYLEPFMYHKVLLTGTDFENFINLRSSIIPNETINLDINEHFDVNYLSKNKGLAEIHIRYIADLIKHEIDNAKNEELQNDVWYTPYGNVEHYDSDALLLSIEKAARISFTLPNDNIYTDNTFKFVKKLYENVHASPFEHCAKKPNSYESFKYADTKTLLKNNQLVTNTYFNNFHLFFQLRKMIDLKLWQIN